MRRVITRPIAVLAATLLAISILVLAACASPQTAAQRFAAMPPVDDVVSRTDWYQPTVVVRGTQQARRPNAAAGGDLDARTNAARWDQAFAVASRYHSLSVVVRQHNRIASEWYAPESSPARRLDSQSMHRGLLALLVGAAIADGAIAAVDTPIERFLPEWRGEPRGRITVADLLYGRSGFVDPDFALRVDNPALLLFIGTDLKAQLLAMRPTPGASPGRGAAIESQLLGLILERATRKSYAHYLSERLWRPIGADDALVRLDRPGGHTRTLCCLQATARDWARVGQLVLDKGRVDGQNESADRQLIPAAWIDQLRVPNPLQPNMSMYWFLDPTALAPRAFGAERAPRQPTAFKEPGVLFAGGRGGLRVYVIPSHDAVVVRLGKLRYDFDDGEFLNPFIEALSP